MKSHFVFSSPLFTELVLTQKTPTKFKTKKRNVCFRANSLVHSVNRGKLTWIHKDEKVMAPPFHHSLPPCASHPILFLQILHSHKEVKEGWYYTRSSLAGTSIYRTDPLSHPAPCLFICRSNSNRGFPMGVFSTDPIIRDLWSSVVFLPGCYADVSVFSREIKSIVIRKFKL